MALLLAADEVITLNGKGFDELVLRRHHKLGAGALAAKGKHTDLFAVIFEQQDSMLSLHRLAELNLGEKKHTKGREMVNLELDSLKEACRSDVWQTYRLWELWRAGRLKIPEQRTRAERDDPFDIGPGHHMPELCPGCHAVGTLILIDYDIEEMSEGQEADYVAGISGSAYCDACKSEFDWGM
ncbi:MAG: hypothetical protein ACLPPF_13165 [Rhodomicrobium sp.]